MIKLDQIVGMNQHYKYFSLDYFLDKQQEIGFKSIEFWCGAPHFWVDWKKYSDCRALAAKVALHGLQVVSITVPGFANQYQCAPLSNRYHAERSLSYFMNGVHIASELGCGIMTVCSGYGYLNDEKEELFKRSCWLLQRLCEEASRYGVVIAMESLKADESNIAIDLRSTKKLFDMVGHPALKIMVDTIAMSAANEKLEDWFHVFGKNIVHMHFLDGKPDNHNIWGDGCHPLEQELTVLQQNKYTGYLVQEVVADQYFEDPATADYRNMQVLKRFIGD